MVFFATKDSESPVGFLFFSILEISSAVAGDHCLGLKCFVRDQCKPVSILEPQQLNVSSNAKGNGVKHENKRWIFA